MFKTRTIKIRVLIFIYKAKGEKDLIDLHVHTKYSDGTDDIIDILKKSQDSNLEYLSITDHDNCNAYKELEKVNISDYYTGKIIPGVELRTVINNIPIELLGYGVDVDYINKKCKCMYMSFEEKDKIETDRLFENFMRIGVEISNDALKNVNHSFRYGSTYLFNEMKKNSNNRRFIPDNNIWMDDTLFYRKCVSNPENPFFVNHTDLLPSCKEVIKLIKDAGGLVFIPHIYIYGSKSLEILHTLVNNYEIDGVECFYSHFTSDQIEQITKFCLEHNLYMSGGSDYHGDNKKELHLACGKGNLSVSKNIINNWIDKISLM